ncbi:MAG: T9SS type A sorting domain-containing protein [Bacteroidota bacterium]
MRIFHTSILCLLIISSSFQLSAQQEDCQQPDNENAISLSGNLVSAPIVPGPFNFYSGETNTSYRVDNGSSSPFTIFAQNLWLGGLDPGGNPLLSVGTYVDNNSGPRFPQGPLNDDGTAFAQGCEDFNRIWEVRRHEVELHLADYADNGIIDSPIPNVVGWPGAGNAQFSSIYGFDLPVEESLAPFADLDGDNIYEPLDGEYPVEPFSGSIAAHLTWEVYNTVNLATSGQSNTMEFQVNHTQWAFYCGDNDLLNTAVFGRYELENKGLESIMGLKVGIWSDFDLGCFTDDYIGCDTTRNTMFSYNKDNDDNLICEQGVSAFGENPPTQSTVFLNQELFAFNALLNASIGNPPLQIIDPSNSDEFINRLNGLLNDGTPIRNEGLGLSDGEETRYYWPGNPNVPGEWSTFDIDLNPLDFRALGSIDLGTVNPGDRLTIDLAHTFHRSEGNDHLENVELLYQEVDEIQALYDNGFNTTCTPVVCNDDCVWPGDLNNDGIANYVDLVALGFGFDSVGPVREQPIFWAPTLGDSWGGDQVFELTPDLKHLDGNDDGIANVADFEQTLDFYNFTRPDFVPQDFTTDGSDVRFTSPDGEPFNPINPGSFRIGYIRVNSPFPDLRAVTMEVAYDTAHLAQFEPLGNNLSDPDLFLFSRNASESTREIAAYVEEPSMELNEDYELIRVRIRIDPDPPSASTTVRFKNIRGWLADGTEVSLGGMDSDIAINLPNSVGEPEWASAIEIFPNPTKDIINIRSGEITLDRVEVMDNLGRVVIEQDSIIQRVDVSQLPKGMYRIRLSAVGQYINRLVLKGD